jgi:opacity protein-like surface antigen
MRAFATAMLTAAFLAWGAPAAAQTFGFGAHAGVSIPTGDFSDVADLGFSGGLDLFYPLAMVTPALSWYTSADAAGHSASADNIDGGFLTIPVLTGVRLDVGALGMIRPFATGQLGVGFVRGPEVGQTSGSTTTEFAYALGGGLQLTHNIYAGAKWFNLGDVAFDPAVPGAQSVSYIDIYLGFGVR